MECTVNPTLLIHNSMRACVHGPSVVPSSLRTPQLPLSMGFFRQEYWSGLLLSTPGNLPDPGIKPASPALQADSLLSEPLGKPIQDSEMLRKEIL